MSAEQEFYEMARALRDEGVGELVSAPMGLGSGDPEEARAAIRRYRAEAVESTTACAVCVPGAWSEEWPYVACVNCGVLEAVPPPPLPGSPPRWVLWLGGKLRRA